MMDRFADVPQPRYGLFQAVRVVTELESRITDDRGFITGILLNPDEFAASGWVYQVLFFELPFEPWMPLPCSYLYTESDIHPINEEVKE